MPTITKKQRDVHIAMEAAALVTVVPFMLWLSRSPKLAPWERKTALVLGVGSLVVDGALLAKNLQTKRTKRTKRRR